MAKILNAFFEKSFIVNNLKQSFIDKNRAISFYLTYEGYPGYLLTLYFHHNLKLHRLVDNFSHRFLRPYTYGYAYTSASSDCIYYAPRRPRETSTIFPPASVRWWRASDDYILAIVRV